MIELEVTSRCNAGCPGCPRTILSNSNNLVINDINVKNMKNWLPKSDKLNPREFKLSGNLGDAITHPKLIDIISFLNSSYNSRIFMHTNGGVRDSKFWSELGLLSKLSKDKNQFVVRWAIDGLEDTNHIHRINVRWENIMRNLDAYLKAGGIAEWYFIPFDHNEHQIEAANEFCKKRNIKFILRKSVRNNNNYQTKKGEVVISKNQNHSKVTDSTSVKEIIKSYKKDKDNIEIKNKLRLLSKSIACQHHTNKQLFISSSESLWPCCMLWDEYVKYKDEFIKILPDDDNWNNLNYNSFESIIESNFFINLENYWLVDNNNFISRCIKDCGFHGTFKTEFEKFE